MRVENLSGEFGLQDAPALMQSLESALADDDVTIETEALDSVDAGVAQVLLSAFLTAGMLRRSLTVQLPPEGVLTGLFARLGLLDGALIRDGNAVTGPAART